MDSQKVLQQYKAGKRDFSRSTLVYNRLCYVNLLFEVYLDNSVLIFLSNLRETFLTEADLKQAKINRCNLADIQMIEACFIGAQMIDIDLSGADLQGADLREVNLNGAKLGGADLRNTKLEGTDLTMADLRGADLTGVNLDQTCLIEADLAGAYYN